MAQLLSTSLLLATDVLLDVVQSSHSYIFILKDPFFVPTQSTFTPRMVDSFASFCIW